jgi:hypothetical protein
MKKLRQIYRVPLLLALISLPGLLCALLADQAGDAISWLCLGSVIGVILWKQRSHSSETAPGME